MTYNLYENDATGTYAEINADSIKGALQLAIDGVRRIDYDIEGDDDLLVDVLVISADDRAIFAAADVTVSPDKCRTWRKLPTNEINDRYWHLLIAA